MTMTPETQTNPWKRRLPLLAILGVAGLGALTLGDVLSFDTLREQRMTLIAFRDSHYLATLAAFFFAYVGIVAFSLPGATAATLTGGFLFGLFPGALLNITAATLGAAMIFLAARMGFGDRLAARMDSADGRIRQLKAQLDENQFSVLLMIRLVPAVPFFVATLLPAFVGMRLSTFGRYCAVVTNNCPDVPSEMNPSPAATAPMPTAPAAASPAPVATGRPGASPRSAATSGKSSPATSLPSRSRGNQAGSVALMAHRRSDQHRPAWSNQDVPAASDGSVTSAPCRHRPM
jgi:uncharacterized membrane protein YdjX (TVP38/TMEM64 family)